MNKLYLNNWFLQRIGENCIIIGELQDKSDEKVHPDIPNGHLVMTSPVKDVRLHCCDIDEKYGACFDGYEIKTANNWYTCPLSACRVTVRELMPYLKKYL